MKHDSVDCEPHGSLSVLSQRLRLHSMQNGQSVAIEAWRADGLHEQVTYAQLMSRAYRFAALFSQQAADAIIPLCTSKSPDCIAAMCGAMFSGRTFAFLNQKFRPPQIEHVMAQTRASCSMVDAAGLLTLRGAMAADAAITRTTWWLLEEKSFGKPHHHLVEQLSHVASVKSFDEWSPNVSPPFTEASSAQEIGCCLFTSGTTGSPKGVLITTADLYARAQAEVEWYELTSQDVLLSLLPFSFDVGLNQLLSALWAGAKLVSLESWFPKDIMRVTEECQVTGISSVPSIWSDFIISKQRFDRSQAHKSLRYVTVSGGDLTRAQLDRLQDVVDGAGIFKTYGQTEAFRLTSLKPAEFSSRPLSVGRPFLGTRVYVTRDDGTKADAYEVGEVVMSGLGMMKGYLDREHTLAKLRPNPFYGPTDESTHAIFTGDLGYLDEDGYLFLDGRRDDMIKILGNRVYPGEIREQLCSIEGIAQAEVVAFQRDDVTRLAAFVVLDMNVALDGRSIQTRLSSLVPTYMVPDVVNVKPEIPRTASGKPDRTALKEEAAECFVARTSHRVSAKQADD